MRTGLLNQRFRIKRQHRKKREMIKFRNFENENDEFKIKIGKISWRASYYDENKTNTHT